MMLLAAPAAEAGFSTFYLFATAAAAGIAVTLPLVPVEPVGRKYFILMSLVAVFCYGLALLAAGIGFGYLHAAAAGLLILYNVSLPKQGGKVSTALAIAAAACALGGLAADALQFAAPPPIGGPPAGVWLAAAFIAGALVLGGAAAAMVLGHWYLVSRGLSFSLLERLTLLLLIALGLRLLLVAAAAVFQGERWEELWFEAGSAAAFLTALGGFIGVRALFGLFLPLALAFMAWRCARIRSNQSATGILYVALAFVLIGEIIAKHLLLSSRLLL